MHAAAPQPAAAAGHHAAALGEPQLRRAAAPSGYERTWFCTHGFCRADACLLLVRMLLLLVSRLQGPKCCHVVLCSYGEASFCHENPKLVPFLWIGIRRWAQKCGIRAVRSLIFEAARGSRLPLVSTHCGAAAGVQASGSIAQGFAHANCLADLAYLLAQHGSASN